MPIGGNPIAGTPISSAQQSGYTVIFSGTSLFTPVAISLAHSSVNFSGVGNLIVLQTP
jgi:hypothetical protein